MKLRVKHSGETILEIMIAIGIAAVMLVAVYTFIAGAYSASENTENRVIGISLAREGIELVRSNRDTNWLKYSGDRRNSWLCYKETSSACGSGDKITTTEEYYTADFFRDPVLSKISGAAALDIENSSAQMASFRLKQNSSQNNRYEHTTGNDSDFYRQLILQAETYNLGGTCGSSCAEKRLKVISRVQWQEGESNVTRSTEIQVYLYDFYERSAYSE